MTGTKDQREGRSGLRSREWFDNPDHPDMTALYLERYLNYGLSIEELQSDRPIIGIAQTGSDLAPCPRRVSGCYGDLRWMRILGSIF